MKSKEDLRKEIDNIWESYHDKIMLAMSEPSEKVKSLINEREKKIMVIEKKLKEIDEED